MSDSTITVCDRNGIAQADLVASTVRSWALSDYGKATFKLAISDPACTQENLNFGNTIIIQNDSIEDWGGLIWTTRNWDYETVEVTCYSGEYILKQRRGALQALSGSAGLLFAGLIDIANSVGATLITKDSIWGGGSGSRVENLKYDLIYDVVKRIASRAGDDWAIMPSFVHGQLTFLAQWFDVRGSAHDFVLDIGHDVRHATAVYMSEQSDIINDLLVVGTGTTATSTPVAQAQDADSIGQYGLRQGVMVVNATDPATLLATAQAQVALSAQPRRSFQLSVMNAPPKNNWGYLGIGDIVGFRSPDIGFNGSGLGTDTKIRVLVKELDDSTEALTLTVDEVV